MHTVSIACFTSIQLPHSEMALSFKGGYVGAPVSFIDGPKLLAFFIFAGPAHCSFL